MLDLHTERLNRTRAEVFGATGRIDISEHITLSSCRGKTKCRVIYGAEIVSVTYSPYGMRPVTSLKTVICDEIDYRLKSLDRSSIDALFATRGKCDDILIIKEGLVTDTSIANVALFDGKSWYTPKTPLLAGVRRSRLIAEGIIEERDIEAADIEKYCRIALFNAMIDFGEIVLSVDCIG